MKKMSQPIESTALITNNLLLEEPLQLLTILNVVKFRELSHKMSKCGMRIRPSATPETHMPYSMVN